MHDKPEELAITEDEAELYDRQIRLWGLDAQRRLRAARVLLVGLSGLGAEVAKNIILSGIKSITLLDHTNVTEEDRCCQFLVSRDDVGKNRAECSVAKAAQLNPMVEVTADTDDVESKPDEFFKNYDIVCATCCTTEQQLRINSICHEAGIRFYSGDVFGYYGYMFADLGNHEYAEEVPKKEEKNEESGSGEPVAKKPKTDQQETVTVKKNTVYTDLKSALEVDWGSADKQKGLKRTPNTYFIARINGADLSELKVVEQIGEREQYLDKVRRQQISDLKCGPACGKNMTKNSQANGSLRENVSVFWIAPSCYNKQKKFMLEFRSKHKRDPEVKHLDEDKGVLSTLRAEVMDRLKVNKDIVPENFTQHCFAELSPVCAVVGGVLGQEIIKAVSHKDQPHNNFFFFNGVDGSGMVDCIGK